jgi:hypothetical protein
MITLKQRVGAVAIDLGPFLWRLRPAPAPQGSTPPWVLIRNRGERLEPSPTGPGVRCDWRWTSDLHLPRVFPDLGRRLMRRALLDWPIALSGAAPASAGPPEVTFVIGHRGQDRLPLLLATLRSIAGQAGVSVEAVVVEQAARAECRGRLPGWVRYLHTPPPDAAMPYARAWAFNVGARAARGQLLVLHDNDMLVPREYARELLRRQREGHEVLNLKRFVFYLSPTQTERVTGAGDLDHAPDRVLQNAEAGGSVAVSRAAYEAIGGFDESFVGWGGEDNELWERAGTRVRYPFGYLPLVHLWHTAQPGKEDERSAPVRRYRELASRPTLQRIAELAARPWGSERGPFPPYEPGRPSA